MSKRELLRFHRYWDSFTLVIYQAIPVLISDFLRTFPYGFFYYRGVLPFPQRKRLWEKYRTKCRKQRPSTSQSEIVAGSQVCMKSSPMYQAGAIGFTISAGVPKVGQLQSAAWALADSCTFKVLNVQSEKPDKSKGDGGPPSSGLGKLKAVI